MKERGEKVIFLNEEINDNNLKCCGHSNSSFSKGKYLPLIIIQVTTFFEEKLFVGKLFFIYFKSS